MTIKWTEKQIELFCNEYKKLNTPLVWDALYLKFDLRNQMLRREVKPILRNMQTIGPAVTVKGTANSCTLEEEFDPNGPGPLGGMWTRVTDMLKPNHVVVVDVGYTEVAVLGDIFATSWKYAGMQSLVCDGPVRDSFGFLEENIPLFCTYTIPICAECHWHMTDGNVPIWLHGQLGEVLVNPGDFIFGDAEGVLVIPNDLVEKVLVEAQERAASEAKTKADIRAGKTAKEIWGARSQEKTVSV